MWKSIENLNIQELYMVTVSIETKYYDSKRNSYEDYVGSKICGKHSQRWSKVAHLSKCDVEVSVN